MGEARAESSFNTLELIGLVWLTIDLTAAILAQIVVSQPAGREIHVIADNLSAHKTKKVFEFLEANPSDPLHPDLFQLAQSGRDLVFQDLRNSNSPQSPFICRESSEI